MPPHTYVPRPVFIPRSVGVERSVPRTLSAAARALCDRRTIFYDVVPASDPGELVCIGPPLFNLGAPVAIAAQGKTADFTVETPPKDKRVSMTRVRLGGERNDSTIHLRFSFRRFHVETVYAPVRLATSLRRVDSTLAAIQRNNDVQWIRDWCTWHHRVHHVERIVIYDNDSENFDDVATNLAALSGPELVLVRWNFPYGPPDIYSQDFAQTGFLNHCRLVFGGASAWCINLDVDEYLYSSSGDPLSCYLRDRRYRRRQVFYLRSYVVPMTTDREPRRCYDSPWRPRAFHDRARKYIYQPHEARFNRVHRLDRRLGPPPAGAAAGSASRWIRSARSFRAGRFLLRATLAALKRLRNAGIALGLRRRKGALFFFHFRALNTGWKRKHTLVDPKLDDLLADDRITAMQAVLDDRTAASPGRRS